MPRSLLATCLALFAALPCAADAESTRVAHLVVALCDNVHQGIVPVPAALGDGDDPANNLYWGARYGVETFLKQDAGWRLVSTEKAPEPGILERIVLHKQLQRPDGAVDAYLVADAWRGREIRRATERFLALAGGRHAQQIRLPAGSPIGTLDAGGASDLVGYVGHNGLMDFEAQRSSGQAESEHRPVSFVLACASLPYFAEPLATRGARPLLLTTGLMAPEAYTVAAIVETWFDKGSPDGVREAAAKAYDRYQKCGVGAARRLFWAPD